MPNGLSQNAIGQFENEVKFKTLTIKGKLIVKMIH